MHPTGAPISGYSFAPLRVGLTSSPFDPEVSDASTSSAPAQGQLGPRVVTNPGESRELRTARLRLTGAQQELRLERARFPGPVVQGEPSFSTAQKVAAERVAHAQNQLRHSETIEATVRAPLQAQLPAVLVNMVSDYLDLDEGRSCGAGRCVPRTGADE